MHTYWHWLAVLSLAVFGLERALPRDKAQRVLRKGIATDVFYIVFNGHFLGVLIAMAATPIAARFDGLFTTLGFSLHANWLSASSLWLQFSIAFFLVDFMQWGVHNLLHRVPFLWRIHQVHHSILDMDFMGSMRLHFGEAIVYKSLLYVPLALVGFSGDVLFWLAIVGTFIGHMNHANTRLPFGPLVYFFNSPQMHLWHHAHPSADAKLPQVGVNFGINLSLWDWIFQTAYLPSAPPCALGFEGIEHFPTDPLRQVLAPLPPRLEAQETQTKRS